MGWVRLDDDFYHHRKVMPLSIGAKMLFVMGLCYCAENLTDGFVSTGAARSLCGMQGIKRTAIAELVEAGLWHKRDDGFEVHEYLQYQPSGAEERARRSHLSEQRALAGRRGGLRSGDVRRSKTEANVKQNRTKPPSNGEANRQAPAKHQRSPDPEVVLTSRSDLHGWAPGVTTSESEVRKAIELIEWLWEVMAGQSLAKVEEVVDVVCWAMSYLDGVVVEEAIGHLRERPDPPKGARYVAKTLRSWGAQRGVEMPEWRMGVGF